MFLCIRERMEGTGMASIQSRSDPIENLWAILKQELRKQTVFWENLEEKL